MEMTNEKQVEYLFARFHHLLGFEEVINVQSGFPDITALRNGEKVSIELEFRLCSLGIHYLVDDAWFNAHERFEILNGKYCKKRDTGITSYNEDDIDNLYVTTHLRCQRLLRRSLKPVIDIVICWSASPFYRKKIEGEDIEVIELKSRLKELGVSW